MKTAIELQRIARARMNQELSTPRLPQAQAQAYFPERPQFSPQFASDTARALSTFAFRPTPPSRQPQRAASNAITTSDFVNASDSSATNPTMRSVPMMTPRVVQSRTPNFLMPPPPPLIRHSCRWPAGTIANPLQWPPPAVPAADVFRQSCPTTSCPPAAPGVLPVSSAAPELPSCPPTAAGALPVSPEFPSCPVPEPELRPCSVQLYRLPSTTNSSANNSAN